MPERPEIIDHVSDLLAPLGPVEPRFMFGGWGLYLGGVMFALNADGEFYLRTDSRTAPAYEAQGLPRFKPWDDKPVTMPYHLAPEAAFETAEAMVALAQDALAAARQAKRGKRSRTGKARA